MCGLCAFVLLISHWVVCVSLSRKFPRFYMFRWVWSFSFIILFPDCECCVGFDILAFQSFAWQLAGCRHRHHNRNKSCAKQALVQTVKWPLNLRTSRHMSSVHSQTSRHTKRRVQPERLSGLPPTLWITLGHRLCTSGKGVKVVY